jgi:hypothetical protein
MRPYSFSVTDLDDFESNAIEINLDSEDAVLDMGMLIAREMADKVPDLKYKGMCVVLYDRQGEPLSIFPLDPIQ